MDLIAFLAAPQKTAFSGIIACQTLQLQQLFSGITGCLDDENLCRWAAMLGIVLAVSRAFIQEPGGASEPELALLEVVAHTHYLPRHWRGRAHTREVQQQFQQLFQFKARLDAAWIMLALQRVHLAGANNCNAIKEGRHTSGVDWESQGGTELCGCRRCCSWRRWRASRSRPLCCISRSPAAPMRWLLL